MNLNAMGCYSRESKRMIYNQISIIKQTKYTTCKFVKRMQKECLGHHINMLHCLMKY